MAKSGAFPKIAATAVERPSPLRNRSASVLTLPSATLAEQAYGLVKQAIFDFDLMPGDRFSEAEVSHATGVSRTPLRQALQQLQREGFVQVFPKSGWRVAPLDFDVFDQLTTCACCSNAMQHSGCVRSRSVRSCAHWPMFGWCHRRSAACSPTK
jgi:DNA-binding transcriptional regulator YhcF (GntR family)